MQNKTALLATGNELILGDTTNTNSQYMAKALTEKNIRTGMQLVVSDEEAEIIQTIEFLLTHHRALIITGGLGPTSDDRTRFALGKALNTPLVFFDDVWLNIVKLFEKRSRQPEECAKQQALFPKNALIFANKNGTAAGCEVLWKDKLIYLLPGPPRECWPIFDMDIVPRLIQHGLQENRFRRSWTLFNAPESYIASQLDPLAESFHGELGYRLCYPDLEIRLFSDNQAELETFSQKILPILEPHLKKET